MCQVAATMRNRSPNALQMMASGGAFKAEACLSQAVQQNRHNLLYGLAYLRHGHQDARVDPHHKASNRAIRKGANTHTRDSTAYEYAQVLVFASVASMAPIDA
jgi:hypothetical protein